MGISLQILFHSFTGGCSRGSGMFQRALSIQNWAPACPEEFAAVFAKSNKARHAASQARGTG